MQLRRRRRIFRHIDDVPSEIIDMYKRGEYTLPDPLPEESWLLDHLDYINLATFPGIDKPSAEGFSKTEDGDPDWGQFGMHKWVVPEDTLTEEDDTNENG